MALDCRWPGAVVADRAQPRAPSGGRTLALAPLVRPEEGKRGVAPLLLSLSLTLSASLSFIQTEEEEGEGDAAIVIVATGQIHRHHSFASRSLASAEPSSRPPSP